ncbi:MAG: rhomboid family intramembrane serine protease [Parachlamydiales bacterium]|nr:rhomboid family intramembrane serine protease [Parachlamydiales bacterium]
MRLIGQLNSDILARKFLTFLHKEGVEATVESKLDAATDAFSYLIWVHDEDALERAKNYFMDFQKQPDDEKYNSPVLVPEGIAEKVEKSDPEKGFVPPDEDAKKQEYIELPPLEPYPYKWTLFFLLLCSLVFFVNVMQELRMKKEEDPSFMVMTPIQYYFLFDEPYMLKQYADIMKKYHYDPALPLEQQNKILQEKWKEAEQTPYWKGVYELLIQKVTKGKVEPFQGKLFEKIREGQVWRLFTPCILHTTVLHILFNMIWLWILGKQVEERLSKSKYVVLTLVVGIISNIAQYIMSGPYFLGYSGIIMGLAGFIWSRQKVAPWEGYPLQKGVFLFLAFYVLAILALQIFSLILTLVSSSTLNPPIANSAHIVGFIAGWLLGKCSWFSMEEGA